ncbi:hypothetical protein KCA24_28585, partial [Escherichia coli]|nr:hypothetical protein [Escherichia coli]
GGEGRGGGGAGGGGGVWGGGGGGKPGGGVGKGEPNYPVFLQAVNGQARISSQTVRNLLG